MPSLARTVHERGDDVTADERLEEFEAWLEELTAENETTPVIVEGARDEAALRRLGLAGRIVRINAGKRIFHLSERFSRTALRAIVLVDWDRTGGRLSRMLQEGLEANQVKAEMRFRRELVRLARGEIKDVESAPALLRRLRALAGR